MKLYWNKQHLSLAVLFSGWPLRGNTQLFWQHPLAFQSSELRTADSSWGTELCWPVTMVETHSFPFPTSGEKKYFPPAFSLSSLLFLLLAEATLLNSIFSQFNCIGNCRGTPVTNKLDFNKWLILRINNIFEGYSGHSNHTARHKVEVTAALLGSLKHSSIAFCKSQEGRFQESLAIFLSAAHM